jgi:hypothetical protein
LRGRPAFFRRHVRKAWVLLQLRHKISNGKGRPCQKQVDALLGQQDGALEQEVFGTRQQGVTQGVGIWQRHELIGGNIQDIGHLTILEVGQAATLKKIKKGVCLVQNKEQGGEK